MKKAIYKFNADCGRMGSLQGVLVSTKERVDKLIESKVGVYFGEVLGKHSEIFGSIEQGELKLVSDNEEAVRVVENHDLTSGFNPFEYSVHSVPEELEEEEGLYDMTVGELVDLMIERGI